MQIVIDNELIQGYAETLSGFQILLQDALARETALREQADTNQLLTIAMACNYLSVSEDTILYYRKHGLEYYKKGREGVWYRKGDIDDWLKAGKVNRHSH